MSYEGDMCQSLGASSDHDLRNSSNMNDWATSIWNRTGRTICFYLDPEGAGDNPEIFRLPPGGSSPYIGDAADRIRSWTTCG